MKVLRTVYIKPRTDDKITKMMKQTGKSRNEIMLKALLLGMKAESRS